MQRAPTELMAKGLNFRGFLRAVERLHSPAIAEQVVQALPIPEARDALRYHRIVASGWYPVAWHRALHVSAQAVTGSSRELARRIGYEGMRDDLGGVYRLVASLLAPETLVRIGNRLWSSYWNGGVVQTVEHGPGHVRTSFSECHGFDRNSWEDIIGSCQAVLEAAHAGDVRLRVLEGGVDGAAHMVLDGRWVT